MIEMRLRVFLAALEHHNGQSRAGELLGHNSAARPRANYNRVHLVSRHGLSFEPDHFPAGIWAVGAVTRLRVVAFERVHEKEIENSLSRFSVGLA